MRVINEPHTEDPFGKDSSRKCQQAMAIHTIGSQAQHMPKDPGKPFESGQNPWPPLEQHGQSPDFSYAINYFTSRQTAAAPGYHANLIKHFRAGERRGDLQNSTF